MDYLEYNVFFYVQMQLGMLIMQLSSKRIDMGMEKVYIYEYCGNGMRDVVKWINKYMK